MDFDSPEVMKDFPGLYSLEKKKGNDSDYNDDIEKTTKKDMLIGKRKDKKDKKDKDKGYAALEGESSDEASPCKTKKSKAFKFSKSKDKEKHKEKGESSKKNRTKKTEKPQKSKKVFGPTKQYVSGTTDLADALPIFGVDLEDACKRGRCHDGITIPLPVRECVDYVQAVGLNFEGVYKISGPKAKVSQIRKMYNNRQMVRFSDYDVPTATSVLKMFLRDLPEPIFTNELLIRFEEAGAIFNYNTREKHLRTLIESLPALNRLLLGWLIVHLHNITLKEQVNKMNKQALAQALNHTFHVSSRLLQALITHKDGLFPGMNIMKYYPPLESGSILPDNPVIIEKELGKLESLLSQIHWEMQNGHFSKTREEHLWEVQRITTELKRKLKKFTKIEHANNQSESAAKQDGEKFQEETIPEEPESAIALEEPDSNIKHSETPENEETNVDEPTANAEQINETEAAVGEECRPQEQTDGPNSYRDQKSDSEEEEETESDATSTDSEILEEYLYFDEKLITLRVKNSLLKDLIDHLTDDIGKEKKEIEEYQRKIKSLKEGMPQNLPYRRCLKDANNFNEVQVLLARENHMLQIKKLHLVRQIMEQKEHCIDLTAKLKYALKDTKEQKFLQCKEITMQTP